MKKLFLFPDTNVFVQCKPLDQVDWSSYAQWDSVDLYLTRPVQSEVDTHKGKGSGRLAKRARTMSSSIRALLESETGFLPIRDSKPTVRLYLKHELKKDDSLAGELDYGERDDQLVGIASGFLKSNPGTDVRLLTHDTGPMASAKLVGLAYDAVASRDPKAVTHVANPLARQPQHPLHHHGRRPRKAHGAPDAVPLQAGRSAGRQLPAGRRTTRSPR